MAKTRSKHQKDLYSAYKSQNRFSANRKRKLLKLQKEQPNNEQIVTALANIKYRRKTPGTAMFNKTKIASLTLMKQAKKGPTFERVSMKDMFSLATRAHTKQGETPWSKH